MQPRWAIYFVRFGGGRVQCDINLMTDDATLLHRYVAAHDETAFAEFVQRRIGLVYSTALRQLAGDDHLARDATQLVFIDAARKARVLARHPLLTGWLYTATHHATAKLVRGEQRRRFYENHASTMNADSPGFAVASTWEPLRPLLDAALRELGEVDRSAILLRFFENQSFSVVGRHLRLSEDAARKRVDRALEKLHAALARRGIVSTSAALAATLSTQAVHAAPAGLAQAVAVLAVKSAAGSSLAAAALRAFLTTPKFQLGVAATLAAIVGTGVAWQQSTISTRRAEIAQLAQTNRLASAAHTAARERLAAFRAVSARGQNPSARSLDVPWNEGTFAWLFKSERDAYPNKWAAIVRRLRLQPDTITELVKLDFERRHAGIAAVAMARREGLSDRALAVHAWILFRAVDEGFEERYRALLGKDGYALLKEYQRTVLARNELGGFAKAAANANVPVSDHQMDALATLLTDSVDRIPRTAFDRASPLPEEVIAATLLTYIGSHMVVDGSLPLTEDVLERARAILTPAQHEKLTAFQSARLALREIDARNRVAAAHGELRLNPASSAYYPTAPNPAEAVTPAR